MTILLIDNSYFNFFRFHATVSWYNRDPERQKQAQNVSWLENQIFMKTFEKMWFETLNKLDKKFKPDKIYICRDGNDVWRYKLYPEYKSTRKNYSDIDKHSPGPVFKYVNSTFPDKTPKKCVFLYNKLAEGDDIIAICTEFFKEHDIIIISGDHDLLQLSSNRVHIYQLKGMKEITSKQPFIDLMIKILAGDQSDNIPQSFPRCGKKTAEKLAKEPNELEKMLKKHGRTQFDLNKRLIDFNYIDVDVKKQVVDLLKTI
jgi:5'-3' exonuclease